MTVCVLEVVEQRLQRVAGALEGREAGADDGAEHHPVARLAPVHLVGDEQQHRALADLLDPADGDERPGRRRQRGRSPAARCRRRRASRRGGSRARPPRSSGSPSRRRESANAAIVTGIRKLPTMITVGTRMLSSVIWVTTAAISHVASPPASSSFQSRVERWTKCSDSAAGAAGGTRVLAMGRDRTGGGAARRHPIRCMRVRSRNCGMAPPACGHQHAGRAAEGWPRSGAGPGNPVRAEPAMEWRAGSCTLGARLPPSVRLQLHGRPVPVSRLTSRTTLASNACSRGALNERPLRSVATAQAKKHAAPSAVFQLAPARSSIEPSDGTT